MKNYSSIFGVFLCLWLIPQFSSGQELETSSYESKQEMYEYYSSNQRKLKKTGFILLGAGVASMAVGYTVAVNSSLDDFEPGMLLTTVGYMSVTASIPLFIIAGSNKRKAKALVQMGRHQMMDMTLSSSQYVSLGVRFDL